MGDRKLVVGAGTAATLAGVALTGIGVASAAQAGPVPYVDRYGHVVPDDRVRQVQPNGDIVNATVSTTVVPLVQKAIQVPQGGDIGLKTAGRAAGVQVYRCVGGSWVFDHPEADSVNSVGGQIVSYHHDRGPVWQEKNGGFTIRGAVVAAAGGDARNIPQLLLRVVEKANPNRVGSILSEVEYIQRLDTAGGTSASLPTCTTAREGQLGRSPYSALYVFSGPTGSNG